MDCLECAKLKCEKCSLIGRNCPCGQPAAQWVHVDKYIAYPYCDNEKCLPYMVIDGNIYWPVT